MQLRHTVWQSSLLLAWKKQKVSPAKIDISTLSILFDETRRLHLQGIVLQRATGPLYVCKLLTFGLETV